jgi:NAD+ synthase (glutamine-hydrolysing)
MIASHGEIVAEGPRFSYKDYVVTIATVDVERSRLIRQRQSSFRPMLTDESRCVRVGGINLVTKMGLAQDVTTAANALRIDNKHEEFFHAVALGLFDYVRKSKSWGFVISLSGGVDSSAATCLVSLMLDAATGELGLAGVKQKLDYNPWIKGVKNVETLKREFLACVYQGTKNSSEVTRAAARDVAAAVGATFYDLDISKLVEGYERIVEDATHIKLSWKDHDIARQNIQARVRSPSVWLIANLRRALLLSTSNRSEAAVGYTTMDGDSSGGLSPLGGIDKAYLRTWLRWLETEGPAGLAPIPALRAVNVQEPTAELRPLQEKQTDEKDLMPYEVLDKIERLAIRDKMMPEEVFEDLTTLFAGRYKAEALCYWTIRFFRLWSANQWKRERYAPSFHLDDENLDPKTWCRFPILSGGFEAELKELEASRKATSKRK